MKTTHAVTQGAPTFMVAWRRSTDDAPVAVEVRLLASETGPDEVDSVDTLAGGAHCAFIAKVVGFAANASDDFGTMCSIIDAQIDAYLEGRRWEAFDREHDRPVTGT